MSSTTRLSETYSDRLLGIAKICNIYCYTENVSWVTCKATDGTSNPSTCRKEGLEVRACAQEVLDKVTARCSAEFDDLVRCTRDDTNPNGLDNCRKQERVFYEKCVLGSLLDDIRAKHPGNEALVQYRLYENYGKRFGAPKPPRP